jgi:hypothetical protein
VDLNEEETNRKKPWHMGKTEVECSVKRAFDGIPAFRQKTNRKGRIKLREKWRTNPAVGETEVSHKTDALYRPYGHIMTGELSKSRSVCDVYLVI